MALRTVGSNMSDVYDELTDQNAVAVVTCFPTTRLMVGRLQVLTNSIMDAAWDIASGLCTYIFGYFVR